MKYRIKQTKKAQKTIEFHISKELITEELDRIYKDISRIAALPGFRTGKVPIELVKKRYKKEARDEVVKNLLSDSLRKAIEESDIEMLGLPEISDLEFDEERGMSYKATVDIRPEIKLKNYKGLNLEKINKEVKESDVDAQINNLREMNAKFVTKQNYAAMGDYIICDIECTVENNPVEKKENVWLHVSEDAFIPAKSLEGLKVNDEKDKDIVLPDNYSKKELAGKKANFHIKVKEIKEKILPELNDEFAATVANFKNMAELREAVRRMIKNRNEVEEKRDLENQALRLLDNMASFEAPPSMVERHLEALINGAKERLKIENFSEDKIRSMEKDFRERLGKEASREVRAYFILEEIAKLEDINVAEKEIEESFQMIASSSGRPVEEIKKHYEEKKLIEDLREDIKQRKVLDFIIKNANINS